MFERYWGLVVLGLIALMTIVFYLGIRSGKERYRTRVTLSVLVWALAVTGALLIVSHMPSSGPVTFTYVARTIVFILCTIFLVSMAGKVAMRVYDARH